MSWSTTRRSVGRILLCAAVAAGIACSAVAAAGTAAAESIASSVELRVLVVSDGSPNVTAILAQLGREGVPTTVVDTTSASRPVIDDAFLADSTTHRAHFQAVVLPGPDVLGATEMDAIVRFERTYGVREVDAYVYPNSTWGMTTPSYSGVLDGSPVTLTPAASTAGFGYLSGQLRIDDVDPTVAEVYGYLATGQSPQPPGESYTPLLEATAGGITGSIVGVHGVDGRGQLVITAAFDAYQQYFLQIGPGIVTWLTRGIYLGYQRNYLSVQVDDVFLSDSQWSPEGHCTPGDDCYGTEAGLTTPDIRMQPADVTNLADWQSVNGLTLDMVFNGGGSEDAMSDSGSTTDPLLVAFQGAVGDFGWINHTYSHEYLGCIQVAPTVAGELWHCATPTDYADPSTVFIEPDLAQNHAQYDPTTGVYFLTQAEIDDQISRNLAWAQQEGIPTDPTELVTGEHSGLAILPEQPEDSPNLVPALDDENITALASDASREPNSRTVGPATTVPRHPLNIFYNVDTYLGEVSEYNWYYTSVEDGGSGVCEAQPEITTCITPLPDATESDAENSFFGYIVPTEARIALSFALSNDPRPFYIHQSNLTGQRIIFPVLNSILSQYRSVYDSATTPLVTLGLTGQAQELTRMTRWQAAMPDVDAYVDASGVHVDSGTTGVAVPLTVPAGTTVNGVALSPYGGALSGWIDPPSDGTPVAVPAVPSGGYVGVPNPPVIGTATAGNASADVTWTPSPDNGSPVTGYTVRAYLADNVTPSVTLQVGADAVSATVTGLLNYASYTFTVSASSAVGDSDESAPSNAVVPVPSVPGAPTIGTPVAGDGSATIGWTAPDDGGSPLTLYTVRLYTAGSSTPSTSQDVAPTVTSATFTGLTNGVAYSFDVFAYNAAGPGPASQRSAEVIPENPALAGPPDLLSATAGRLSVSATWSAPTYTGTSTISGYRIDAYVGDATVPAASRKVSGSARSGTVGGLLAGTAYTVTVTAINAAGPGIPSARSAPVTPYDVPGAPAAPSVSPGNASISAAWVAPPDNGSPITSYRVAVYPDGSTSAVRTVSVAGTATSTVVTKLMNGVAYRVSVRAINAAGAGPASPLSDVVQPEGTVPSAPGIKTARSGTAGSPVTATAWWSAPSSTGGSAITGYLVTARLVDAGGAVLGTVTAPMVSSGTRSLQMVLQPGTYNFTVQAVNQYGSSAPSAVSNTVTAQ